MRKAVLWVVICSFAALPLAAQNVDIEALAGLHFNFGNPGARSLGMGGAFLGLADDASAAEANPAGLTILRKPEISFEARNYLESQVLTTSGNYPDIHRTAFEHPSKRVDLTFASFVYPIKNFTVGGYYHESLRNAGGGYVIPIHDQLTGRLIADVPQFFLPRGGSAPVSEAECDNIRQQQNDPFACLQYTTIPFISTLDLQQRTWGLAGAWKYRKLSVGVTLRYQQYREFAQTLRFGDFFETLSQVVQTTGTVDTAGNVKTKAQGKLTFGTGLKFQATENISVGAVYKRGPTFDAPTFAAVPATDFQYVLLGKTTFHIPDVYGLGVSVRPMPVLTINADAIRVTYSNLVDQFISINSTVRELEHPFVAKDVTEVHLGAEYFLPFKTATAIRAGVWRDPAHATQYVGPLDTPDRIADALLYPKGKSQLHKAIGVGLSWSRFQIDAAYDSSENYKVGSASFIARF